MSTAESLIEMVGARATEVVAPNGSAPGAALQGDDLGALMRAVNETAENLQRTHVALREEVTRLRRELAEANARLRRSRALAALGEVAAGIAHEIRNPLGAIQLNAQALAEDLERRPDESKLCSRIQQAVRSADAIVEDVLLFARDMTIRPVPTTVGTLTTQTLEQCEALLPGGPDAVRLELPPEGEDRLDADAGKLVQALANVVRNAVEAMADVEPDARRLVIAASQRRVRCPDGRMAQRVVIAVDDCGPGVPADVVERMFNPFFTTRQTGTGLGLAIVHRIVDAHGGHITVGRSPVGGARVELCLPSCPPRERPADAEGPAVGASADSEPPYEGADLS
jgi:signal transduction histidine kinase